MDFVFRSPIEIEDFLSTFHSLGNKNLYDGFAFIRLGIFQCFVENISKYYLLTKAFYVNRFFRTSQFYLGSRSNSRVLRVFEIFYEVLQQEKRHL